MHEIYKTFKNCKIKSNNIKYKYKETPFFYHYLLSSITAIIISLITQKYAFSLTKKIIINYI